MFSNLAILMMVNKLKARIHDDPQPGGYRPGRQSVIFDAVDTGMKKRTAERYEPPEPPAADRPL